MALRTLNREPMPARLTRFAVLGLSVAVVLTMFLEPATISDAPRENHLSLLGLLVPEVLWTEPLVYAFGAVAFVAGVAMWMLTGRATIGSVLAVAGLGLLVSFQVENDLYAQHQLFQPFTVLAVLSAATAMQRGNLRLPTWVWTAVAVAVGWGYTLAGWEKIMTSGLAWGDGTALRVWLVQFAADDALADWLVATPWAARVCLSATLAVETFAVLGLGFRLTRVPFAFVLLIIHLAAEVMMGLHFFGNEFIMVVLMLTVLIPRLSDA